MTIGFIERITRSAASGLRVPKPERHGGRRRLENTRSAAVVPPCRVRMNEALQHRASERPLVGCTRSWAAPQSWRVWSFC